MLLVINAYFGWFKVGKTDGVVSLGDVCYDGHGDGRRRCAGHSDGRYKRVKGRLGVVFKDIIR